MTAPVIGGEDYAVCETELPLELTVPYTDNCSAGGELTAIGVLFSATECDTTYVYTFEVTDDCGNSATKTVTVTRETNKSNCETAFGKLNGANAYCFLGYGFNRWGWSNKITTEGVYTLPMYAGAAQCDITKGAEVGTVTVTYSGANVTVHYSMFDGYYMSEAHVYVGKDMFPTVKQGKKTTTTVAPGQYTYNAGTLNHATELTVNFTGVTSPFYIIAHAVSCEIICACSDVPENTSVNAGIVSLKSAESVNLIYMESELKAYPNPFNEKVMLEFVTGVDAHAILEITNVHGQQVAILLDKMVNKGVLNRIEYQPKENVSGIYFYRLNLDGNIQTGKLIYKRE